MRYLLIIPLLLVMACGSQHPVVTSSPLNATQGNIAVPDPTIPTPTPPPPPPTAAPKVGSKHIVTMKNAVVGPGVDVSIVGSYTDCSKKAPVGNSGAYFDVCQPGLWIMGHPKWMGGANGWVAGTVFNYYDANGTVHVYRVIKKVVVSNRIYTQDGAPVHIQVCQFDVPNSPITVISAT